MNKYPDWLLDMQTPEGFKKQFREFYKESKTYKKAYERAEQVYIHFYGKRKYKNFESFRKSILEKRS